MFEHSCVKLSLVAWKITFLPVMYCQVKLHRDSHIWTPQMKYEEAAGRALIICETSLVLESSVHQNLDLLIFGNVANSIILFFSVE